MYRKHYLLSRLSQVVIELDEFKFFSASVEILSTACAEMIEAELFDPAENLLAELENLAILFLQSKGE